LLPLPLSGFLGDMNQSPWSRVVAGRLLHFSKYPNFHDFCKDNLVAFRKGPRLRNRPRSDAPKTFLAALLIFFRDALAPRPALRSLVKSA
jgi:hypothetical protein